MKYCNIFLRSMKLTSAIAVTSLFFVCGCDGKYKDEIGGIQEEIDAVKARMEKVADEVNSEIEALTIIVRSIEQQDYIEDVESLYENGEISGYRIRFFKGGEIVIMNGKNGTDAKDGHSPLLGAKLDTDGRWYWTMDGEWLLDKSGTKVTLSPDTGINGAQGSPGSDGKDGVSPVLKIENDMWYYSLDGGYSWTEYGRATGADGKDGADGVIAETIFDNIYFSDGNAVFVLKNGSVITVPVAQPFSLALSQTSGIRLPAGGVVTIGYEISGSEEDILVCCAAESGWKAIVEKTDIASGFIRITAPTPFTAGKVVVFASARNGRLCVETLTFEEIN